MDGHGDPHPRRAGGTVPIHDGNAYGQARGHYRSVPVADRDARTEFEHMYDDDTAWMDTSPSTT
jgi:hypothetical protein